MRRNTLRLLLAFVAVGSIGATAFLLARPAHVEKPIIAQLFAEPARFAGRTVEVYGLVIQSDSKSEFLLQDVSQRPIRVIGTADVGDQVTVIGRFHSKPPSIFLAAERLSATKVVGGGGCC